MKKTTFSLAGTLLIYMLISSAYAQVPQAFNYQAIARNGAGVILDNQAIGLKLSIHESSSSGTTVYSETHAVATNQFGLFTVNMGQGTVDFGDFTTIKWNTGNFWLQVEMDPEGGTNYSDMGTAQLLSVPFAMYAAGTNVEPLPAGASGQSLRHDGTDWIASSFLYNDGSKIGIGTITPTYLLDVQSPAASVIRTKSSGSGASFIADKALATDNSCLVLKTNGVNKWSIGSNAANDFSIKNFNTNMFSLFINTVTDEVSIGTDISNNFTSLNVPTTHRYAGFFTSDSISYLTHVIHAEYLGTSSVDARAVYGKSVPSDNWGIGGEFIGGYQGVRGMVNPTGSSSYYGVMGNVSGGNGNNKALYGYAAGSGTNYGLYASTEGAATANYGIYANASGATTNYAGYFSSGHVIVNDGKVGVGTTALLSDLDINQSGGSGTSEGTGGINLRRNDFHWRIYNSNNYVRFNYSSDGGTTYTPKAYINPSDGSWNQLSDISLKTNIEKMGDVLDKISAISILKYNYIDNAQGTPKVIGASANELAQLFPEIVSRESDGDPVGVDYSKFGVIAIKAIQELNAKIEQLEKRIAELEKR